MDANKKRKRRFGDRNDGRRIRTKTPIEYVQSYIMPDRIGASNYIRDSIDVENIDKYIQQKRREGLKGFGFMHVFVASYIRVISQRPGINRFIAGQRTYTRDEVIVNMIVKKDMALDAPETALKLTFKPDATAYDVYEQMTEKINEIKESEGESSFDGLAKILNYIPGILLKFAVWLLKLMDYFGLLPKFLIDLSPFHGSLFITSMASLGIPPIYHHLYDFGTLPVFCAFGAKNTKREIQKDGSIKETKYIDYTVVSDERICDGFYYASALKLMKVYMKRPQVLDKPPETVVEDIE